MNAHQLLTQTRELLSDPARWTKGSFGRTADGAATGSTHSQATCWCIIGAMEKTRVEGGATPGTYMVARAAVAPERSLINFNDAKTTTHQDVLDALDQAIERTKPS